MGGDAAVAFKQIACPYWVLRMAMCAGTPSGSGPEPAVKGKEGFPELPGTTPLGHSIAVICPVEKLWKRLVARGKAALFKAADRSAPLAQQSRSADAARDCCHGGGMRVPAMKTLPLANGDRMPILGLGTWKSEPGQVEAVVREAIRLGYRHIDCAWFYGNEREIGRAIAAAIAAGEVRRDQLWITSKLWSNSHGRERVEPALRETLEHLELEWLDLYLIHWPIPIQPSVQFPASAEDFLDPVAVPLSDTWAGMEAVAERGLTRHIGVSNVSIAKLQNLMAHSRRLPEVNQVELHPLLQQHELVSFCQRHNIPVTAYSPLGSMDRPSFVQASDAPVLLEHPEIVAIAAEQGCTPAQVLLAWHVQRNIAVIPKTVTLSRLRQNLEAAAIELSPSAMARIAQLDRGYRFIDGRFWVLENGPWSLDSIWDI